MHQRPLGRFLAVLFVLLPLTGQAQERPDDEQEPLQGAETDSTNQPAVEVPGVSPPSVGADSRSTPHRHNETGTESDQPSEHFWRAWFSRQDTVAQWLMMLSGFLAVGISLWAVLLVRRSLEQTREAIKETRRGTIAAERSVEITADSAQRQLRAYVNVINANVEWKNNRIIKLCVHFKNTGQTPAKECRVYTGYGIGCPNSIPEPDTTEIVPVTVLGAGSNFSIDGTTFSIDDVDYRKIRNREMGFYVIGVFHYIDIFDKPHITRYFLKLGKGDLLLPHTEGNEVD